MTLAEPSSKGPAFITTDIRLIREIAKVSDAHGQRLTYRSARPMADLYVAIYRIWNGENARKPFSLKGKQGLWKQIDQQYLADALTWSVKTVERNLKRLSQAGLIRYERQGYIQKKYVQLVPIELAQSFQSPSSHHADSVEMTRDDTQVSAAQQTRSRMGNRHEVGCATDTMSVPNKETEDLESFDRESFDLRGTIEKNPHPTQSAGPRRTQEKEQGSKQEINTPSAVSLLSQREMTFEERKAEALRIAKLLPVSEVHIPQPLPDDDGGCGDLSFNVRLPKPQPLPAELPF